MNRRQCLGLWLALAGLLIVATPGAAQTGKAKAKGKAKAGAAKKVDPAERASGVIVKVSEMTTTETKNETGGRWTTVTINTAAVWRDWVRDQATTEPKSPREAARKGANSVATDGQPISPDTVVNVIVGQDARIETRYRSATDEVSEGAKTPSGAAAAEASTDAASKSANNKKGSAPSSDKAEAFTLDEIQPGLFVEVDYRRVQGKDRATVVRVLRPIGGQGIPAGAEPKK